MAHPQRREAAIRLAGGVFDVVTDPDPAGRPSAFRTSLLAWSSIPSDATHHLLLHDDMVLSGTFFERAESAARAMPHAALALFAFWNSRNGAAVRQGALAGARWVPGAGEYTPVAALLLPRQVAGGYVEWARDRGDTWPDDVLMGRYLRQAGVPVFVAVPSLAEHEDLASLVDNDFQGLRRSPCFFADDPQGFFPDGSEGFPPDDAQAGRSSFEESVLGELPVIPFFKRGVAQCAVRVPGTGRWRDIRCEDYLAGRGIDADSLRAGAATRHWPLWLTAYTMGIVHSQTGRDGALDGARDDDDPRNVYGADPRVQDRGDMRGGVGGDPRVLDQADSRDGVRVLDQVDVRGGVRADPRVLDRALATMGPGGLCHELGARELARLTPELHEVARAGLEAGLANRPGHRPRAPRAFADHPRVPQAFADRPMVALTGADTFVRDHLVGALADHGCRTVGPEAGAAVVVHVCALGWDEDADPEEELRLARAAFADGRGGVLLSSCAVYGHGNHAASSPPGDAAPAPPLTETPAAPPLTEAHSAPLLADSPAAPPLVRAIRQVEAAAGGAVVLRLGEPYGPGMPQRGAVAELVLRSSLNRPAPVTGSPAQLVHVQDVARAVLAALAGNPVSRMFNIANPERLGMRELAEAVSGAVRPLDVETSDGPPKPLVDVERAAAELGWRPSVTLDYGLHTCAQWLAYESDRP
ncbi:NAD-dependent epimerase/dehydratase family protein [Nonomuraea sp. CA-143628]|uniref:NAD-dependent epimerase/dehydratase family protein n=1 Tax=Nonomuraea sp. CA-143628 TaxID=3239997 RepID=UPI003D90F093